MLEGEKYELGDSPSHREGIRPDIVSPDAPSEQGRWVDRASQIKATQNRNISTLTPSSIITRLSITCRLIFTYMYLLLCHP